MDVRIDAAAVEQAVSDAIVSSAIGAKIKFAVNELLSKGHNNPIDDAIKKVIGDVALRIVSTEYAEQIKAAVVEKMKDESVSAIVERFWDAVLRNKNY